MFNAIFCCAGYFKKAFPFTSLLFASMAYSFKNIRCSIPWDIGSEINTSVACVENHGVIKVSVPVICFGF